jgi:thioredoxin:protein disulfide reductase
MLMKNYQYMLLGLSLLFLNTAAFATNILTPVPADQAFIFSVSVNDHQTLTAHWAINPGYYLYKNRFTTKVMQPQQVQVEKINLPQGLPKYDDVLGQYEVYQKQLDVRIPLSKPIQGKIILEFRYQGCAEANYCYPPISQKVTLDMNQPGSSALTIVALDDTPTSYQTTQEKIAHLLASHHIGLILLSFFGFGLLLSLTPCVLPMIPILSGIILGHGTSLSKKRVLLLSVAYVLGMAFTYSIAGLFAGLIGGHLQAAMQSPWIIVIFSGVFIALALSLFGLYDLHLPNTWQTRLSHLSQQQKAGHFAGVMLMGALATLIISPCVTPPLIAALAYLAQTGDAAIGGSALFMMGLGMGVPLMLVGVAGGHLLPKAGAWMNTIKAFFAILLLITAVVLLSRIIPGAIVLVLWASVCIIVSIYLGLLRASQGNNLKRLCRSIAVILLIYGTILLVGASMGNTNPLKPLAQSQLPNKLSLFTIVKSSDDLDQQLTIARQQQRLVMLDFYADWCIACKDMARNVFEKNDVRNALIDVLTLQADVTLNDKTDKALQKRFGVVAPPTILFFDRYGNELPELRIVGEMNTTQFLHHLDAVKQRLKTP